MTHARKLMALLLALILVLGLSVTAFATGETGTITVDNPQADQTYTAYKIFDVTYNTEKSAYAYTIDSSSKWFATVKAYADVEANGLKLTQVGDTTTWIVEKATGFSAASFANALKVKVVGDSKDNEIAATGKALTLSSGKATVSGLELGYYFVTSSTGALCNLTTTNPTITIHDKNDVPFEKTVDFSKVGIGDAVEFRITGKVPDTTGFETYTYQITDKMSNGLTFNNDVKVYINGAELTDTTKYTLKTGTAAGDYDFVLDIDVMNLTAGAKIAVKYSATVNENAAGKIEKNKATLEYSNDPTDSSKTTTREDEETVACAKIVVDKYAANPNNAEDKSKKLADAQFILYYKVYAVPVSLYWEPQVREIKYYKYVPATESEPAKVEWTTNREEATVMTTDENGVASFPGLYTYSEYWLEEVKAPAGYNKLTEPILIRIWGDEEGNIAEADLTQTASVANNAGTILPATGGMGTTLFYVVGSILLLGAAVLLITKKRMGATK